jgi:hypothetical protein
VTWLWQITGTANSGVNLAPATGAVAMWNIISALLQAGWTKKADSDGTTYSSSGVQVTSGATGTNGLGNNSAWVRISDPANLRELSIQRGTSHPNWRIKWSHSAKFTVGTPTATLVASATDEQVLIGTGTDAAPTGVAVFGSDGLYHLHVGTDNAAPYDFWWMTTATSGGATQKIGNFLNMTVGSYPSADVAPYVVQFGGPAITNGSVLGSGYYKKGLSGELWCSNLFVGFGYYGAATVQIPKIIGVNAYSGNDNGFPVPVGIPSGTGGAHFKGFASMNTIAWSGSTRLQFDFEDTNAAAWAISTAYVVGARVQAASNVYLCQVAGTSLGSGSGPTGTGNAITDNTVTWSYVAPVARFTVFDSCMLRSPIGILLS